MSWRWSMRAALLEREGHRRIGLHRADAVDAGHRSDDDHVVALQQRARRRMAHAVDLLVDGGFLLDIGVGARDIGFRLVVVVIGDEIFHRVVGKERLELAVELGGQRLVRRQDQRRALRRLDHLGHGEGLARAGDAEQHLRAVVALDALDQFLDRLRLVALRLEVGLAILKRHAAFGFVRPRRPVRRPAVSSRIPARPSRSSRSSDCWLARPPKPLMPPAPCVGRSARGRRYLLLHLSAFRLHLSPRAGRGRRAQRVG